MAKDKGIVDIRGKQYQTVAYRIGTFRKHCPITDGWAVVTEEMLYDSTQVIYKAYIIDPEGRTVSTGTAQEFWDADRIHSTSSVEIAETSAVGRALAFAGLGGEEIASAEEMFAAMDAQEDGRGWESSGESGPYEPPSLPGSDDGESNKFAADSDEARKILSSLRKTAKEYAEKLANQIGEDEYAEWHEKAMRNLCSSESGMIDDVESIDGLTIFIDGQKNKLKED